MVDDVIDQVVREERKRWIQHEEYCWYSTRARGIQYASDGPGLPQLSRYFELHADGRILNVVVGLIYART